MKVIYKILLFFLNPLIKYWKHQQYLHKGSKIHGVSGLRVHRDGFVVGRMPYERGNYWVVKVSGRVWAVHILVADCFIPNPDNLPIINHLDGNSYNNRVSNLERNTLSGNTQHAYKTGLIKRKLTYEQAQEIKSSNISRQELSKQYKVSEAHIGNIKNGYSWNY